MATVKYTSPGSQVTLSAAGLNGLANGAASAFITHDNSSAQDLYASVAVTLGSIVTVAGASLRLHVFSVQNATAPDNTATVGGGEVYVQALAAGTGVKTIVFPFVRLVPESMRFSFVNNAGVALAGSGNAITVRTFNESVS